MSAAADSIQQILRPVQIWSAAEIFGRTCPIPRMPGVYGMYFRAIPATVPIYGCNRFGDATLLYVGISPQEPSACKPPSNDTLHDRIRFHLFSGNAEFSTFRLSLGCLLSESLGIQLRRTTASGKSKTFGDNGEGRLSMWIAASVFVAWAANPEPWLVEKEILRKAFVPLNIKHNKSNYFASELSRLRCQAKSLADELPVHTRIA